MNQSCCPFVSTCCTSRLNLIFPPPSRPNLLPPSSLMNITAHFRPKLLSVMCQRAPYLRSPPPPPPAVFHPFPPSFLSCLLQTEAGDGAGKYTASGTRRTSDSQYNTNTKSGSGWENLVVDGIGHDTLVFLHGSWQNQPFAVHTVARKYIHREI